MIRRSTVVYIMILFAVLAVYLYANSREPSIDIEATPAPTTEVSYLFPADEGTPTDIQIKAKSGETVELARNPEAAWTLKQPIEAGAEQASSEAASSQVSSMRVLEKISKIDPGLVGLKEPEYILTVKFDTGTERTVHIGVVTPTESGYYVQDASGGEILILTKSSVDALLGLLTAPPYLETPSPSLSPFETGTVIPAATPTP
jgi:uncharacterized protein DUF4340